ncbi:hypothetical protein LWI29_026832 [Acer saccharum]|uniref:Uncharacterized protein n=1 Tax=Acer saccharum TaxID=4024 RepID=A0AA39S0I9_ACESA|nr:hypothetical protein LWI29_026832 [Acer saccharum]
MVSGIAPPQDYGSNKDKGVEEETAEGISEETLQDSRGKPSGSDTNKRVDTQIPRAEDGTLVVQTDQAKWFEAIAEDLMGATSKAIPVTDLNVENHPPSTIFGLPLAPSREIPTAPPSTPIVPFPGTDTTHEVILSVAKRFAPTG